MNRWSQFVVLTLGQLSYRISPQNICHDLAVQSSKLYYVECVEFSRSCLSRVNYKQQHTLFEALFHGLLSRCQGKAASGHRYRFKSELISFAASTVDLCLTVFPWTDFHRSKGGIKLHVDLDRSGYLPSFVHVSEASTYETNIARSLDLHKSSIVVFDRGYADYPLYKQLTEKGVFILTRLKQNADCRIGQRREVNKPQELICEQIVHLSGYEAHNNCGDSLRRIGYRDPDTGKKYALITNPFQLSAKTNVEIYKALWQIEIFFKRIKQNLKIKILLGASKIGVLTQIWVAMCVYLLPALIKFSSPLGISLHTMSRLLPLNIFKKRPLIGLFKQTPKPPKPDFYQLRLVGL